jgi:hypothetical protein
MTFEFEVIIEYIDDIFITQNMPPYSITHSLFDNQIILKLFDFFVKQRMNIWLQIILIQLYFELS